MNAQPGSAGIDPSGGNYVQLVPNQANQFGYQVLNNTFDVRGNFSVSGYFNPTNLSSNGSGNSGDWIGLILLPVDPSNVAVSASYGGGGLGIAGIQNALALGVDMYQNVSNPNYNDPSPGPFAALRWTGSSGTPQPLGATGLYTSQQNLMQWGKALRYTLNYFYNGGDAYLTGSITDSNNAANTFTFDTRGKLGITLPPQ
ncbi:MAG TPA: hypothetical protein DEB31_01725, partial [Clostridiales bacterium]|nr:hypothetical protein [Clostridiales bacterium]